MMADESIQKPVYINDIGCAVGRLGASEATGQNRQVRTGPLGRDAFLETGQRDDRGIMRLRRTFGKDHRSPEVHPLAEGKAEARGHHTDDRMRLGHHVDVPIRIALPGGEVQVPADRIRVRAQVIPPEGVTDDHHARTSRLLIFRAESASLYRLDIQQGEEVSRGVAAHDLMGSLYPVDVQRATATAGNRFKYVVVFPKIEEVRTVAELLGSADARLPDPHQLMRVLVGQGPQHHGVDHTEQRCVGRDRHRQNPHHERRKPRIPRHHPKTVSDILPKHCHRITPVLIPQGVPCTPPHPRPILLLVGVHGTPYS